MSYKSIDELQKALGESIFTHTKDSKKAAGRALGTFVEIITYYLLKEWGLSNSVSIERPLSEYGNQEISHNVEFTLHPVIETWDNITIDISEIPIKSSKILKHLSLSDNFKITNNSLIDRNWVLRNSCSIAEDNDYYVIALINKVIDNKLHLSLHKQHKKPYAMFECKRVGVEDGCKKGPQTIEKAKQGAYVAKTTSSLQKIRDDRGNICGIIYCDGKPIVKNYSELLEEIIQDEKGASLKDFTLSVGIVSNHGNWFTSNNQNKELKVLSQSYDWLLFLSDEGLASFIESIMKNETTKNAFINSYRPDKKANIFTKTKIHFDSDQVLTDYFHQNIRTIEKWFNVIAPDGKSIDDLKNTLNSLKNKNWRNIL